MLVERKLVQEVPGNLAHRTVADLPLPDREPVDDRPLGGAAGGICRPHVPVADVEVLLRRKESGVVAEEERLGIGGARAPDGEGAFCVEDVVLHGSLRAVDLGSDGRRFTLPHRGEGEVVPNPEGRLSREGVDVLPDHPGVVVVAGEGQGPDQLRAGPITDIVDVCVRHRPRDGDRRHASCRCDHLFFSCDGKNHQTVAREEECLRGAFDPGLG